MAVAAGNTEEEEFSWLVALQVVALLAGATSNPLDFGAGLQLVRRLCSIYDPSQCRFSATGQDDRH